MNWCKQKIGSPSNTCCRSSSCSTGPTRCGTIPWYGWCHADDCCAYKVWECSFYDCYQGFDYGYHYSQCIGYVRTGTTPQPPTPTSTSTPTPTPVPSCTMSLSPSSLSLQAGQGVILTANVNLSNATVREVRFSSNDTNIARVDPSSDSSSPYRTQVNGVKGGSTTISSQTLLNPSGSCSASAPVTVESAAWFQTQGGDIHAQGIPFPISSFSSF